ncbi:MAG: cation:dicarboxylase symporter family transporter [bacterium]
MRNFVRSLPAQLMCAIAVAFVLNMFVCNTTVGVFFTVSSLIKEVLEFFLPYIVFFFVASGVASFARNSLVMVLLLVSLVTVSNALTGLYAYGVGVSLMNWFTPVTESVMLTNVTSIIAPFFSLHMPSFLRADYAMLAAVVVGCLVPFFPMVPFSRMIVEGKTFFERGLSQFFIPLLPLYVLGFFLKMMRELPVSQLCGVYGVVFVMAVLLQIAWLVFAYSVAHVGRIGQAIPAMMIAAPSYLTALGTMSSVATLPVSIACAEKNTGNRSLVQFAMPILANIHLMGDAVCVPLFALATMKLFFGVVPALGVYVVFLGYLCLAMLAVSGIPGGGIIVMLPLLQSLFGFTPEMLSIMTALYLLQDGFGTAANVMGDGALVIALDRLSGMFIKKKKGVYGAARSSK